MNFARRESTSCPSASSLMTRMHPLVNLISFSSRPRVRVRVRVSVSVRVRVRVNPW